MAEVSKIDPKDFEPGTPITKIDPSDFVPDTPRPKSVMAPLETTGQKVRRIGTAIGQYDPSNPANMGRVLPLAVGAATAGANLALGPEAGTGIRLGTAAAGGFLAPYTQAATARALGEKAQMPSVWDALKSAGMNLAFEGAAETGPRGAAAARALEQLPKSQRNFAQLAAQGKLTDVLKSTGMDDAQIAEAMKDPEGTAAALQRSYDNGQRVDATFKQTVASERTAFENRFQQGYEIPVGSATRDLATVPTSANDIGQSMVQVATQSGQHELTPAFRSWLERKGKELSSGGAAVDFTRPLDTAQSIRATEGTPTGGAALSPEASARAARELGGAGPQRMPKEFTVQDLADLRTELRENRPSNMTALDRKAYAAFNTQITAKWEQTLRENGMNEEQIGRLKGVYEDWGKFQETVKTLRPDQTNFGEQLSDAFFKTAKQNPTLALNFAKMAEDSGTMPQFREAWLKQITSDLGTTAGGPTQQLKALQKFQTEWGSTKDGQAVLSAVWGKNSPLADPVEMSRFLGSLDNPGTTDAMTRAGRTMSNVGFLGRQALFLGIVGGSVYRIKDHPEELPAAIAALGTLAVAGPLMSRLSVGGQRAMIKMLATPNPETVQTFFRIAGPSVTAGISQPSDQTP